MSANNIVENLLELESQVNSEILERKQEIHTAILALIGRKHHVQLGPPGIAKSKLVERINKRISGFGEEGYFRWLMTNYTVPEELYGGPNFQLLKEKGIYKRVTEKKMPRARVVFLDEIFKGNSSILNTNLTIMNERMFFNHDDDPAAPLLSVFAASNEFPASKELDALWDRLHYRHVVRPLQESSSFINVAKYGIPDEAEHVISLNEILAAHAHIKAIKIPDDVFEALNTLKKTFLSEGIEGVTDRRWIESTDIIRSEAFLNGREIADIEDMRPLMHTLWYDDDHRTQIRKLVLELANPLDKKASDIFDRLLMLEDELDRVLKDNADNHKQVAKSAIEIQGKLNKANSNLKELKAQIVSSGRKSEHYDEANNKFVFLAKRVMKEGFNVNPE